MSVHRITKIAASGLSAMFLATTAATGVAAAGPYPTGQSGYDVSYPQCGSATTPPPGSFGIVGVNGGRPFSNNACLAAEFVAAPGPTAASLYINTGYSGAYGKDTTAGCSSLSSFGSRT